MRVWKQPAERRVYTYDFLDQLAGQTIALVLAVESEERGGLSVLAEAGRSETPTTVQIAWTGGLDGKTYRTTVRVRDTALQEHELEGEIFVSNVQFTLPTGIVSAYLTGEEYVDRFGFEETVKITDELRRGAIDAPAVSAALVDAQNFAEGYLATRYTLPLPTPAPELLRAVIADLARERLHKTRPTLAVTQAADRARSILKDLSAGRAILNLPSGAEPPATTTGGSSPIWGYSQGAVVNTAEKLARF